MPHRDTLGEATVSFGHIFILISQVGVSEDFLHLIFSHLGTDTELRYSRRGRGYMCKVWRMERLGTLMSTFCKTFQQHSLLKFSSCIYLLLRTLLYLSFAEVVTVKVQNKKVQYTSAIIHILQSQGFGLLWIDVYFTFYFLG